MRYIHGRKPRNPYNMIIQENHVAGRATIIIPYRGHYLVILFALRMRAR